MDAWPTKSPNAVLDHYVDWRDEETGPTLQADETIVLSEWLILSGTVVQEEYDTIDDVAPIDADGAITAIILSGGALAELCTLRNTITTSEGRIYDKLVRLRIREQ